MSGTHPATQTIPPTSLYIHVPWCVKKCPYCDFNSHTASDIPEERYLEALLLDLRTDLEAHPVTQIETIFIGGGTPSLMSGSFYHHLLEQIEHMVPIKANAEITLEANPGATEASKFAEFRQAGINRLSIGVQSFDDQYLQRLGRIHSAKAAIEAITQASKANFQQINLDLMFGLPHQSLKEALRDLETAIQFETTHLSWYQLTIEPNTQFYRQRPTLPSDDAVFDIYESGREILTRHHFNQYEISAYSRTSECQHNLNYWHFGDYLGIGAGAHGKISIPSTKSSAINELEIVRYQKTRLPKDYLNAFSSKPKPETSTQQHSLGKKLFPIQKDEHLIEFLLNALRIRQGFSLELAQSRTNLTPGQIKSALAKTFELGLLQLTENKIKPTSKGWNHINSILEMLL